MARPNECSVTGCNKPLKYVRDALCAMHYARRARHGDVGAPGPMRYGARGKSFRQRIEDRMRLMPNGCIEWTGARQGGDYGTVTGPDGRQTTAHRVVYEMEVGPIPDGLTLDHLCRNRICVNVDHLEPVTRGENTLRGDTIAARNRDKTHCVRGHELSGANLEPYALAKGHRSCVPCRNIRRGRGSKTA